MLDTLICITIATIFCTFGGISVLSFGKMDGSVQETETGCHVSQLLLLAQIHF